MTNLIIPFYQKEIVIDERGQVISGEIVKVPLYFTVERSDMLVLRKHDKEYKDCKTAYKALVQKAKKYPRVHYRLYVHFIHQQKNYQTSKFLFEAKYQEDENTIVLTHGYERIRFATISLKKATVEHAYEFNEQNDLLIRWLPQQRKRKETWMQTEIRQLQSYNIENFTFNGLVDDENKKRFFVEAQHCLERINNTFSMNEFFPIKRMYFSTLKKYAGIYRFSESAIAFRPTTIRYLRDTFYHEYGHHLYNCGLSAPYDWFTLTVADRRKASELLDEIMTILDQTDTIQRIHQNATQRMEWDTKKKTNVNVQDYYTDHENYLLLDTEMFARLFEAYMIQKDQAEEESMVYALDYTVEEVQSVEPLLLQYLEVIQRDYAQDVTYRRSKEATRTT